MPEKNDKLETLRRQVQAAAELDAKKILDDAEKEAKSIIDEENARLEKEHGAAALAAGSRFESEVRKRVSESRYNAERKVLLHRNKLVDELFGEIESELKCFAESDRYVAYLADTAKKADNYEKLSGARVYCRKVDMPKAEKALSLYGLHPETDRNILLGGLIFKYPDKGIYLDLTLDSALAAEREAFSANAEMQL